MAMVDATRIANLREVEWATYKFNYISTQALADVIRAAEPIKVQWDTYNLKCMHT
jgi:hypothetical protein